MQIPMKGHFGIPSVDHFLISRSYLMFKVFNAANHTGQAAEIPGYQWSLLRARNRLAAKH